MAKKLYIAATGQHKGKTTCTLGLAAAIKKRGVNVGYCKPVGQTHLMVRGVMTDKDAVLFEGVLGFEVQPEIHSPVVVASGLTAEYIEDPSKFDFESKIKIAAESLEKEHELIIYEGTGHAGVGSVIDLSNAQVAKLLDAEVILIIGGGIGRAYDRLNLNLSLFREQGVRVKGVILNKVHVDKLDHVKYHMEKILREKGIPLLGILPFDRKLSFPLMGTVKKSIKGLVILNSHKLYNQVEEILAGSFFEINEFTYFRNMLLIVNQNNFKKAIDKIKYHAEKRGLKESPISGVILTGDGRKVSEDNDIESSLPYLIEHEIPLLATALETYDTVVTISRIEVKINTKTPWKVARAIQLIEENVDVSDLVA